MGDVLGGRTITRGRATIAWKVKQFSAPFIRENKWFSRVNPFGHSFKPIALWHLKMRS